MRLNFRSHHSQGSRRRLRAGWALLFFAAHAFVAGASHLHGGERLSVPPPAPPGVSVGEHEKYKHNADANGHLHCLLCRLQRNLVADTEGLRPFAGAPTPAATLVKSRPHPLSLDDTTHPRAGRAPPTA